MRHDPFCLKKKELSAYGGPGGVKSQETCDAGSQGRA
jgi:hypothetical protein